MKFIPAWSKKNPGSIRLKAEPQLVHSEPNTCEPRWTELSDAWGKFSLSPSKSRLVQLVRNSPSSY